jgi:hypothetical protein
MNKVIFQLWEEYERYSEIRPSGCSLHLDHNDRNIYIDKIYSDRIYSDIPDEYDKISGVGQEVFIDDLLYNKLLNLKSIRLNESSMRNLISMSELIIKDL